MGRSLSIVVPLGAVILACSAVSAGEHDQKGSSKVGSRSHDYHDTHDHHWFHLSAPPRGPVVTAVAGPQLRFSQDGLNPDALRALAALLEKQPPAAPLAATNNGRQAGPSGGKDSSSALADPTIPGAIALDERVRVYEERIKSLEAQLDRMTKLLEKLDSQE